MGGVFGPFVGGERAEASIITWPRMNPGNCGDVVNTVYDGLVAPRLRNEEGTCGCGKWEGRHGDI
jgi:hypothetical protein